MAVYSITPGSETNYLNNPVLLYEKYFKKISEEIGVFNNPLILKSLAIVSFFGTLDINNEELKAILSDKFGIDWNELWVAIMELHNSEILDVYSNEIVRVSDQVLATYAFYECFIDDKSAVINYAEWITTFMDNFSNRVRTTLIDVNNTFVYPQVRDLVLPHLNEVIKQIKSEEELYAFYKLFWFYKGRDCLLYLKKWIENLPQEQYPETLKFSYVHNEHTYATKYFKLLNYFWDHTNELFRPSLELTLALLNKQPSRLPEILKFINEDFKYKLEDIEYGYLRQNMLLDILLDDKLDNIQKLFANGIFLNLAKVLLGWHYDKFRSAKGQALDICEFKLCKSDKLIELRGRILNQVYYLFESENEQLQEILYQIIYHGGDVDKSIYVSELPIYQKIISEKLDNKQYVHCEFVSVLAKYLTEAGTTYPENWNEFIESDVRKLFRFLKPYWEYRKGKSNQEFKEEKTQDFDDFVKKNDWQSLEKFLLNIYTLYEQLKENNKWQIKLAVNDIYKYIAKKNKLEFENALRLFFSDKVVFPLCTTIMGVVLRENIMTGKELLNIISDYEFKGKPYWISELMSMLPEEQVDEAFLKILIKTFLKYEEYINKMLYYVKYEMIFEEYKKENPELENHNIITYLTSIVLTKPKPNETIFNFGIDFFADCSLYFTEHIQLLKEVYWAECEINSHFDYKGRELKAILDLDKNFITESFKNGKIELGFLPDLGLEKINISILWEYEEYEELIENFLLAVLEKEQYTFIVEDNICSLFSFKNINENIIEKAKILLIKLIQKHSNNEKFVLMLVETVYHNFNDWFIEYFKEFLLTNKNVTIIKEINFERSESWSGSRVPLIQKKIDFCQDILRMINTLPNILDYSEHIDYFEQEIAWKKKEIEYEQRKDFMEEFY